MLDFSIYLLYRAVSELVRLLPLRMLFALGSFLGSCAWMFLGNYRALARRNLVIAFGKEKSPPELRRLARVHFQRLAANLFCSVKMSRMPVEQLAQYVEVENIEAVHKPLRAGRPVVLVLSHLGNWELIAQLLPAHIGYVRNSTIYQKLGNRFIDAHVRKRRARSGVEMFERREGFQKAIDLLRAGGAIGILSDQHAGDQGLWTPFFGKLASTSPLPGLLAKRTHAVMIGAAVYSAGNARWRMTFTQPFDTTGDSMQALTARANQIIEEQIRAAPEDWFWVHNRWKTPKPSFLVRRYKRGAYLPPGMEAAKLQPFRILIRGSNWLGDSVISAPAVRAIKNGRPDAHLTVAAPKKIAAVWELVPEVDEVLSLPDKSLLGTVKLIRAQPPYDVAILFPNSLRTALEVWLAGIARRAGARGHHRSALLNQIVRDRFLFRGGPPQHQANHYLLLARKFGATAANQDVPPPARSPAHNGGGIKIGLCPGAEYGPAKRWLPERFSETASAVGVRFPVQWVLFGTAADAEAGRIVAQAIGENCVNRIGQTSLEELISELRECRLLLSNDTGTMHLATLLGVPVVAVFGSTEPRFTGPLGHLNRVVRRHVECSPCFLRECPIDFRCMKAVTSEEVATAVLWMLENET